MSWSYANSGNLLPLTNVFPNATSTTVGGSGGIFIPSGNLNTTAGMTDFREFFFAVVKGCSDYTTDLNADLVSGGSGELTNLSVNSALNTSSLLTTNEAQYSSSINFTLKSDSDFSDLFANVIYDVQEE